MHAFKGCLAFRSSRGLAPSPLTYFAGEESAVIFHRLLVYDLYEDEGCEFAAVVVWGWPCLMSSQAEGCRDSTTARLRVTLVILRMGDVVLCCDIPYSTRV
jgi:hypothetical protein